MNTLAFSIYDDITYQVQNNTTAVSPGWFRSSTWYQVSVLITVVLVCVKHTGQMRMESYRIIQQPFRQAGFAVVPGTK